jgi:hypothetical protein
MPFTPFHFGPGFLIKTFFTRHFNFLAFVLSQVFIDFETAYNILNNQPRLHTYLHTFIGSLFVIPVALLILKFCHWYVMKFWPSAIFERIFVEKVSLKVTMLSLFIGVWSHVLLDSIMHADARPFWPISKTNPFLDFIEVGPLHFLCLVSAAIGLVWFNRSEFKKIFVKR